MRVDELEGAMLEKYIARAEAVDPAAVAVLERMRVSPAAGRYDHIYPPTVTRHSAEWADAVRNYIKSHLGEDIK